MRFQRRSGVKPPSTRDELSGGLTHPSREIKRRIDRFLAKTYKKKEYTKTSEVDIPKWKCLCLGCGRLIDRSEADITAFKFRKNFNNQGICEDCQNS